MCIRESPLISTATRRIGWLKSLAASVSSCLTNASLDALAVIRRLNTLKSGMFAFAQPKIASDFISGSPNTVLKELLVRATATTDGKSFADQVKATQVAHINAGAMNCAN